MSSASGEESSKYVIGSQRRLPNAKGKETENGNSEITTEYVKVAEAAKRPGFVKRSWGHFKRWWCCYGLAVFVFLAIFLPVL